MDTTFERGQLIVPNENLYAAFYFEPTVHELREDMQYRVATSAERIFYYKNIENEISELKGSVNDYKKSKSDVASKAASEMAGSKHKLGKF